MMGLGLSLQAIAMTARTLTIHQVAGVAGELTTGWATRWCQSYYNCFPGAVDLSHDQIVWILYYMVMYPEKQKKLQQELDSVIGRYPTLTILISYTDPKKEAFQKKV